MNKFEDVKEVAEQGDGESQLNLGLMYVKGEGVLQDYKESVKWFTKSAEQGHDESLYNLGILFLKGKGVQQDYIKSLMYFNLAELFGNSESKRNKVSVERKMTQSEILESEDFCKDWMCRHLSKIKDGSEQGNAKVQNKLGEMFRDGNFVTQNYEESVRWFTKSVEQDHSDSFYNLGMMYYKGKGVKQNYELAGILFNSSRNQDSKKYMEIVFKKLTPEQRFKILRNGRLGIIHSYYENGEKESDRKVILKNNKVKDISTYWYKNGKKRSEINYKDGNFEGLWVEWHENGQKWWEINYKNGKEEGLSTWWDEEGNVTKTETYKDGLLVK
jgi:TPR repeat protein